MMICERNDEGRAQRQLTCRALKYFVEHGTGVEKPDSLAPRLDADEDRLIVVLDRLVEMGLLSRAGSGEFLVYWIRNHPLAAMILSLKEDTSSGADPSSES